MDAGVTGFTNAPVTKALLLLTTGSSLLLQGANIQPSFGTHGRALLETFLFQQVGELAFGTYLLYTFRTLERQRGSESFGAQSLVVLGCQQVTHWAVKTLTKWPSRLGPHALIASGFVSFLTDIPVLQNFKVLGIPLTDKVIVYAAGLQLAASAGRSSVLSFVLGGLVGLAFQSNLFGCRRWKVPRRVSNFLGRAFGAVLGGNGGRQRIILAGDGHIGGVTNSHQAPAEVSPEALSQLVAMGFEEQAARSALQHSHNDVQQALSRLL